MGKEMEWLLALYALASKVAFSSPLGGMGLWRGGRRAWAGLGLDWGGVLGGRAGEGLGKDWAPAKNFEWEKKLVGH